MKTTLEEVTKKAMTLPKDQRFALVSFLLAAEDSTDATGVAEAWDNEIQARIQSIDSGSVIGVPLQDVMQNAKNLLTP